METQIDVKNLQTQFLLSPRQIARRAKRILKVKGVKKADLSIAFVTDARIRSLNKKYLKTDRATDVLAFDFLSMPGKKPNASKNKKEVFGEIIISTGAVCRQSKIFGNSRERELALYLIHGILHLLGFDDHKPADIKKMRREEERLLNKLKTQS